MMSVLPTRTRARTMGVTSPVAFTLIELLVVVAIIAILASLLLPALAEAKRSGKKIRCTSNVRQITTAVLTYTSDGESRFPIYGSGNKPVPGNSLYQNLRHYLWGQGARDDAGEQDTNRRLLTAYLGEFLPECPLDEGYRNGSGLENTIYAEGNFYQVYGSSYAYQFGILDLTGRSVSSLGDSWGSGPVTEVLYNAKTSQIDKPSQLVLAGDFSLIYADFFTYSNPKHFLYVQMHRPSSYDTNMGFVDGHVAEHPMKRAPNHLINGNYQVVRSDYEP